MLLKYVQIACLLFIEMFECDITLQGLEVIFEAYSLFCVELLGQDALENDSRESDESESY